MRRLINRLPLTRMKLFLARVLYRLVHLIYRRDKRVIVRNGITYEVDLSEGIDLSVFLFGNYQKYVYRIEHLGLHEDAIIFDVGANCGIMSLQFARMVPQGKVYCFEPTHYAYSKLLRNLQLNPDLAARVVAVQTFVSCSSSRTAEIRAYASWKVGGRAAEDRHPVHGGTAKSADGVASVSLDDFCRQNNIERVDFIKIDTDGHELEVLKGAEQIIRRFRPPVIFEVGIYLTEEREIGFGDYLEFFGAVNYSLVDSKNLWKIDACNYGRRIPLKRTIDILAAPIPGKEQGSSSESSRP